ncbi:hypothetical protein METBISCDRAFT_7584, partial [Metschnikowia bicuspidata]
FRNFINSIRISNVPAINFATILTLLTFLFKLTTKYRELYMKSSLITTIVTNLVLYGISESLAQTILSFRASAPLVSFYLSEPVSLTPATSPDLDAQAMRPSRGSTPINTDLDLEEEDLYRFIDFLGSPNAGQDRLFLGDRQNTAGGATRDSNVVPEYTPTYFEFSRLTGFMCWGFLMAFAQCWWYKFLQIYSKHPQFVEVLRKVMSDQFCFSPVSLFCFFTYGTMVLESGTWEDTTVKLRKLYLQTLVINYSVWFPVQFINFLLIPRDFQVPFSSSVSVLWNCFLSMRNSSA